MAWAYILECADGSFYVGSTVDLDRRISQHNAGEGAAYTRRKGRRPVTLVWAADFARVDEAFAFEKMVQGWSRKKRIALIEDRWNDLPALAAGPGAIGAPPEAGGFETVAAQPAQPPAVGAVGCAWAGGFETVAAQPPQPPAVVPRARSPRPPGGQGLTAVVEPHGRLAIVNQSG